MRHACTRKPNPHNFLLLEHGLQSHQARPADLPHGPCLAPAPCFPGSHSIVGLALTTGFLRILCNSDKAGCARGWGGCEPRSPKPSGATVGSRRLGVLLGVLGWARRTAPPLFLFLSAPPFLKGLALFHGIRAPPSARPLTVYGALISAALPPVVPGLRLLR